ncbi:MAG: hypothetical protein ACREMX_11535 [Gemmatimonadales bacterium]
MPKPRHLVIAGLLVACGSDPSGTAPPTRSYYMGFSAFPPRPDTTLVLPTLTLATQHSDAGLIQLSIPWQVLLDGISAAEEVRTVRLPLANYYRAVGQPITVALDVTDGLNRAQESPELIAAGRSITEPPVQELYRRYVNAVDTILRPEYLSLAAETNLIRLAASAPVYAAIVAMAGAAAGDLRARGTSSRLLVSVQVEAAWGALQGGTGFVGIALDRTDFPFADVIGLSSYPYLGGYDQPEDIPLDYYSRLVADDPLPQLVLEGGWPSVTAGPVVSSPELQSRYIRRHAAILDRTDAAAVFQITFTDLDLAASPPPPGSILPLFAHLGLVDSALGPKPALAVWDSLLALDRRE